MLKILAAVFTFEQIIQVSCYLAYKTHPMTPFFSLVLLFSLAPAGKDLRTRMLPSDLSTQSETKLTNAFR
jgi:hypothetical protein